MAFPRMNPPRCPGCGTPDGWDHLRGCAATPPPPPPPAPTLADLLAAQAGARVLAG